MADNKSRVTNTSKLLCKLIVFVILISFSYLVVRSVAGPQYFNPNISDYTENYNGYQYKNGTLEIGQVYGNSETTLIISSEDFTETQYISFDRLTWTEIKEYPDFTRLGNINIEKGRTIRFYLKSKQPPKDANNNGLLIFGVSAFGLWENPIKLLLFIAVFSFIFKIYEFLFKDIVENQKLLTRKRG